MIILKTLELQRVTPKYDVLNTWMLPSVGFEWNLRKLFSFVTVCFLVGRTTYRFRVYWNLS